jgi:hypothetical protein
MGSAAARLRQQPLKVTPTALSGKDCTQKRVGGERGQSDDEGERCPRGWMTGSGCSCPLSRSLNPPAVAAHPRQYTAIQVGNDLRQP